MFFRLSFLIHIFPVCIRSRLFRMLPEPLLGECSTKHILSSCAQGCNENTKYCGKRKGKYSITYAKYERLFSKEKSGSPHMFCEDHMTQLAIMLTLLPKFLTIPAISDCHTGSASDIGRRSLVLRKRVTILLCYPSRSADRSSFPV